MQKNLVRPIVEFLPLWAEQTDAGRYELFSEKNEDGTDHPHYAGVKNELKNSHGIYIFYDSRGRALYAGKAKELNLWAELKNAFNRPRNDVQKIKLVRHPNNNVRYRAFDEKRRKIVPHPLKLYDLATYFSAYQIQPTEMIPMFEALIIRAFANDLLNIKMEGF